MNVAALRRMPAAAPADTEAQSLPAWIYRDAEFFARERQAIFRHSWQVVCQVSDVPRPESALPQPAPRDRSHG